VPISSPASLSISPQLPRKRALPGRQNLSPEFAITAAQISRNPVSPNDPVPPLLLWNVSPPPELMLVSSSCPNLQPIEGNDDARAAGIRITSNRFPLRPLEAIEGAVHVPETVTPR
jgi:hypothetical protein